MSKKTISRLIGVLIAIMVLASGWLIMFDTVTVTGGQIGVMETWWGGVQSEPLPSRTYVVPLWKKIYPYNVGIQVFEMSDGEKTPDSYLVQSSDSQDMHLSLQTQWRIDPSKVVDLHRMGGAKSAEERYLRPALLRIVKDKATTKKALDAYSGEGLVKLQQEIQDELTNKDGDLTKEGIIVESFVIQHIKLDAEYTKEIIARQVAIQKEMRAVQEEKAAQADALKAKAVAQADLNKSVVEAERDKQVVILKAKGENEKAILAAEAEKQKTVLAAEAKKESGELEAAGILAVGRATAEAEKMKYQAYAAEGADVYAKIQIAESMSKAFGNIKGYLPEGMTVNLLGDNFTKAVEALVGPPKTAIPAK